MGKSILVTGGAGFIGSHLVEVLVEAGHAVRVLDNLEPQAHGNLAEAGRWPDYCHPGAEYVLGDVRDRAVMERSAASVEVVYHLAATTGMGQSMYQIAKYTEVNVQGTANLLEAFAQRAGQVERVVLSSSRAVYGEGLYNCQRCGRVCPGVRSAERLAKQQWDVACPNCQGPVEPLPTPESKPLSPGSIYAVTKQSQEQLCLCFGQAYQVPVAILRLFNVYGPRQSAANPYTGIIPTFLGRLRNHQPPEVYEDGRMTRDFVHVSDAVRACMRALDIPHALVANVGSGQPTALLELAQLLADLSAAGVQPQVVGSARVGDIRHCSADLTHAKATLGYDPVTVSPREGLQGLLLEAFNGADNDVWEAAKNELMRARLLR